MGLGLRVRLSLGLGGLDLVYVSEGSLGFASGLGELDFDRDLTWRAPPPPPLCLISCCARACGWLCNPGLRDWILTIFSVI